MWKPDATRRPGRPSTTLRTVQEEDTVLEGKELLTAYRLRMTFDRVFVGRLVLCLSYFQCSLSFLHALAYNFKALHNRIAFKRFLKHLN